MIHSAITADVYGEYLCSKRKSNGGLLKPGVYRGLRSSLTYLFMRYGEKMDEGIFSDTSEILKGVSRTANEARQAGEGNLHDRKRELSFPLYCAFNRWCVEDGRKEAIY